MRLRREDDDPALDAQVRSRVEREAKEALGRLGRQPQTGYRDRVLPRGATASQIATVIRTPAADASNAVRPPACW